MNSNNPTFNEKTLNKLSQAGVRDDSSPMSMNGTINKIGILVLLTLASSAFSWSVAGTPLGALLVLGSVAVNLVLFFVLLFKKSMAPTLAPVYAVVEGLFLGSISYYFDQAAPGIALHAFVATFAILFAMVGLYHYKVIQATATFKKVMMMSMLAIVSVYLVDLIMMFMGQSVHMVHEASPTGILFSLFVVGVASLNFILDFDMIEKAVERKAPKWMEWYAGFAVLVTIVWLYLEILRLFAKARK